MKTKLTDKQKMKIAGLYIDGASGQELATKFGVSLSAIFNALRRLNVKIRPRGRPVKA